MAGAGFRPGRLMGDTHFTKLFIFVFHCCSKLFEEIFYCFFLISSWDTLLLTLEFIYRYTVHVQRTTVIVIIKYYILHNKVGSYLLRSS